MGVLMCSMWTGGCVELPEIPPHAPEPCPYRDTTEFVIAGLLPEPMVGASGIVVGARLYIFHEADVWVVPLGDDGMVDGEITHVAAPLAYRHPPAAAVIRDRLYLTGGGVMGARSQYASEVFSGRIEADGSIGTWTREPDIHRRGEHAAIAVGDILIVLGGVNAGEALSAQSIELTWREGDTLRTWTTIHDDLPADLGYPARAARVGDTLYYGATRGSGRLHLDALDAFEASGGVGLGSLLEGGGSTLFGVRYDVATDTSSLERSTLQPDGTFASVRMASIPPSVAPTYYESAPLAIGAGFVYAFTSSDATLPTTERDDRIWVAPLCAD